MGTKGFIPEIKKYTTTYQPPPPGGARMLANSDHPSFIAGIESLLDFHDWVARVVLPIAFQWIEENYDEVYEHIDQDKQDDVDVVIAAAYQLIQDLEEPSCLEKFKGLTKKLASGELAEPDPSKINPIWAKITTEVRAATAQAFEKERQYLDDTIPGAQPDQPAQGDPEGA